MKGFLTDFKKFLLRGNVLDLAVGVIIGAAFGGITKSLVDDVIMPPIGLALGEVDFKEMYVPLVIKPTAMKKYDALKADLLQAEQKKVGDDNEKDAADAKKAGKEPPPAKPLPTSVSPTLDQMTAAGIPTLRFGLFINTIINFVFVAFGVFLIIKLVSLVQKKEAPPPPPGPTKSEELLAEIRDTLKAKAR